MVPITSDAGHFPPNGKLNGWSSPQMLERYGGSARGARARRHYDLIMDD